jgi:hypothetical protein
MGPRMPPMMPDMPGQVTRNTGEGWMKALRTAASIGVGIIRVAAAIQSGVELVTGQDYITGEETSRILAGIGVAAGLVPFGKAAVKGASKFFGRADDVVEAVADVAARTCCFVAGTLVMTEAGLRPIEEIEVGDRVLSRDEATRETEFKAVTQLVHRYDREVWNLALSIEDGSGELESFSTTDDHPWRTSVGAWISTESLAPGTKLDLADGRTAVVVSVQKTDRTSETFNLEVSDFHTYFVGHIGAWVHNTCLLNSITTKVLGRAGTERVNDFETPGSNSLTNELGQFG